MIFCKNCINFFRKGKRTGCDYSLNIEVKHNWEREWLSHIREPRKINKDNNCKWFIKGV